MLLKFWNSMLRWLLSLCGERRTMESTQYTGFTYSVMQSDGNSFGENVVLDSFNMVYIIQKIGF